VQTSSLDGEKNLKKRKIPKDLDNYILQGNTIEDLLVLPGHCHSEQPNTDLYRYSGQLYMGGSSFALDVN
jgi:negative regulator of genetic competence, sporulation and motility